MSFENQEQLTQHAEVGDEAEKRFKISYTRDFLLSLSQLDVCKKLPRGFDESILSETEDVPQDRFRISGGLSLQSYRCNDYSSSPPTRGDGNNYTRGIHGRWDSRSSGRSDRDSDSQSDLDSDSARRGNQYRCSLQVPEHDGLLGSGSFPRPAGYVTGTSGPKSRTNDQCQLNRSNEPYHPPRPYKAVPHLRRDTRDSYNDETFGSSENTSEDRAEEERREELMRKEQHKAFQEMQKNPEKIRDIFDFTELLEDTKDDKRFRKLRNESDEKVVQPTSNSDSDKSSFPSAAPVSRPLVPPGFSSPIVEKNIGNKPLIHPQPLEIGDELDGSVFHAKGNHLLSGEFSNQEEKQSSEEINSRGQLFGGPCIRFSVDKRSEKIPDFPSAVDISKTAVERDNKYKVLEPLEATQSSEIMEYNAKNVLGSRVVGQPTPAHSTSILDKLFNSALTLNGVGPSSIIEKNEVKADDTLTPHMVQSSKFAQWFLEEEKKPLDDLSSSRPNDIIDNFSSDRHNEPVEEPSFYRTTKSGDYLSSEESNDLLSLIVGGEKSGSLSFDGEKNISLVGGGVNGRLLVNDPKKSGSQVFDVKVTKHNPPSLPLQLAGIADGPVALNSVLQTIESIDKIEAVPAVLTCEDLEQSILSEITENALVLPPPVESLNGLFFETGQKKANIDNYASQHLLSLLQKGEASTDSGISSSVRGNFFEKENLGTTPHDSSETENIPGAGKPLTLETLFGTAFMKELKSAGAPTSGQRDLSESMAVDVSESSFPAMGNILGSTSDNASSVPSRGNGLLASNQRTKAAPEIIGERILGFDIRSKVDSSELQAGFRSKLGGFDGSTGVRLPEEDTLIAANDHLNLQNFLSGRNLAKESLFAHEKVDITDKPAAFSSVYQDERAILGLQEGQGIFHGPYDVRESDVQYHKLHGQSSSPQLHPSQLNHTGPRFHPLDSHPAYNDAQMKFMEPENIIHQDPPNRQFPANLLRPPFRHLTNGLTGLDPNPHNPMLQQIHMPGNFPPHLLRGFPRGAPSSPHPNNQVTDFMQEPKLMQGFPFGQKQPNFGGPRIPPQAADVGSGGPQPEELQRLIEMELRSNAKKRHPFPANGHNQGVYGHELDMGFGFR